MTTATFLCAVLLGLNQFTSNDALEPDDWCLEEIIDSKQTSVLPEPLAESDESPASPKSEGGSHASSLPQSPETASSTKPFENSSGMKFSPVSITGGSSNGKHILFCIWETRVKDYLTFAESTSKSLRSPAFDQGEDHPAVYVTYEDAVIFCKWLTQKETESGILKEGQHYRLPTDHEWSCAAGIGELEDPTATPKSKDRALAKVWPWGDSWPPPSGACNLYGEEIGDNHPNNKPKNPVKGYADSFQRTAPVGTFGPNQSGLFEMAGNVSEWVSDWGTESKNRRTSRGGSWTNVPSGFFLSSARNTPIPTTSSDLLGFRCVLDLNKDGPSPSHLEEPMSANQTSSSAMKGASLAGIPGLEENLSAYLSFRKKSINSLSDKYLNAIESRFGAAIKAGDLDLAKGFEAEKKSVQSLQASINQDDQNPFVQLNSASTLTNIPDDAPEGLKELREIWLTERAKIRTKLADALKESLDLLQVELTKKADLSNAQKVKAFSESREANEDKAAEETTPPMEASSTPDESELFENSLGMKFAIVQADGTHLLYSIWETRVQDYKEFVRDDRDREWPKTDFRQKDDHPAVFVKHSDAVAFCEWLTEEERARKVIGENDYYDLPSVFEFRLASGLINSISLDPSPPKQRYLWGDEWPPSTVVGNLYGTETAKDPLGKRTPIGNYEDGFSKTAPVGQFPPSKFGIYDLIGNASEWCSGYVSDTVKLRQSPGGSWEFSGQVSLTAFFPSGREENSRTQSVGFRPVLRRGRP